MQPESSQVESRGHRNRSNRLLIVAVIILVVLLVISSTVAVYFASNQKLNIVTSTCMGQVSVLENANVITGGALSYPEFAVVGSFSAPRPGYLVVTGAAMTRNYSIALEIIKNNTAPDFSITLENGTQMPIWNIRDDSANSTLITTSFSNFYALLPVLEGNVSIFVESETVPNIGAQLNATYYQC